MIFTAIVLLMSSAYAISDVKVSVSRTKATITYSGTPPFLISISETSDGAKKTGGFAWVQTNNEKFEIDLAFAKNPSKTFYYAVKDTEWSDVYSFTIEGWPENKKDLLQYPGRTVFLVSDSDWKQVLQLVPLAAWTSASPEELEKCQKAAGLPENVCVYPALIYHEENENSFDADSAILFLQQYQKNNSEKATIIGKSPKELDNLLLAQPDLGAGLNEKNIRRIKIDSDFREYFSFWSEINTIVYAEDYYDWALIASNYASLINAPLIIKGTALDVPEAFAGKKVICIGNVNFNCSENYSAEEIQKAYYEITETKKTILVNPSDLEKSINSALQPEKSSAEVTKLYGKTSLAAPFLASAKQEIIFTANAETTDDINAEFKAQFNSIYPVGQYDTKTCSHLWECAYGFDKNKPIDFYIGRKSLEFELSEQMKNDANYTIDFYALPYGCGTGDYGSAKVELYNNGRLLDFRNVHCQEVADEKSFLESMTFSKPKWPLIGFMGIGNLEKGTLELRIDGNLWAYSEPVFEITDENTWQKVFSCDSFSSCIPKAEKKQIELENVADSNSSFNFKNIPNDEFVNYSVQLNIDIKDPFKHIDYRGRIQIEDFQKFLRLNFNVLANGALIGKLLDNLSQQDIISLIYNSEIHRTIEIPSNQVNENLQITLEPVPLDETNKETIYNGNALLVPNLFLPNSLTIVAGPDAIPTMATLSNTGKYTIPNGAADPKIFGDFTGDNEPDLAVGRIMGYTLTDASSNIARAIFSNELFDYGNIGLIASNPFGQYPDPTKEAMDEYKEKFEKSGYSTTLDYSEDRGHGFSPDLWKGKNIISYNDHGAPNWAGINSDKIPKLQNSFIINYACSTCALNEQSYNQSFCMSTIRKGGIGTITAVDLAYAGNQDQRDYLNGIFYEGMPIGEAFGRNFTNTGWGNMFTLIGDPTLNITKYKLVEPLEKSW